MNKVVKKQIDLKKIKIYTTKHDRIEDVRRELLYTSSSEDVIKNFF